jgi:SpoVK/Ycf46/Vps4 family AAA+-type ATPase
MTERNIKAMFERAEAEEAVLVIDEADSMLFARDRAVRSWEITFTNEFLVQMENFTGILICTTNRLMDLDSASLRRFDYKIGFDYLTQEGCRIFYDRFLSPLTNEALPDTAMRTLVRLNNLTPGDFKVVREKHRFTEQGTVTHEQLLDALAAESRTKLKRRPIGF